MRLGFLRDALDTNLKLLVELDNCFIQFFLHDLGECAVPLGCLFTHDVGYDAGEQEVLLMLVRTFLYLTVLTRVCCCEN